uniref:Uncharacterized protein n=1 Tax=Meloidogyne enterolobii TaxID=390850 RepID=A0A6V7WNW4_MELEN|nr:unnamed protein product [Meloidogyne enterolobii]
MKSVMVGLEEPLPDDKRASKIWYLYDGYLFCCRTSKRIFTTLNGQMETQYLI